MSMCNQSMYNQYGLLGNFLGVADHNTRSSYPYGMYDESSLYRAVVIASENNSTNADNADNAYKPDKRKKLLLLLSRKI